MTCGQDLQPMRGRDWLWVVILALGIVTMFMYCRSLR